MRTIDADALKEELLRLGFYPAIVARAIEKAPTIDAVPVVRAEWKQKTGFDADNNAIFECTNCLHGDVHAKGAEVPFCWFCGADMRRGGTDGEIKKR